MDFCVTHHLIFEGVFPLRERLITVVSCCPLFLGLEPLPYIASLWPLNRGDPNHSKKSWDDPPSTPKP